jgi:hypothetical protein
MLAIIVDILATFKWYCESLIHNTSPKKAVNLLQMCATSGALLVSSRESGALRYNRGIRKELQMTTMKPTLDEAFTFVRRLPLRERAQLIALIAQDIAAEPVPPAAVASSAALGTAAGLLAFAGSWEGSDLPERIAEVYASRQPIEG